CVHYVLREMGTGAAAISAAGFLTARCAGKDKYFQVVDAAFRAMPNPEVAVEPHATLLKIAEQAGMSEQQFEACIKGQNAIIALNKRWDHWGADMKIESTPTYDINGKRYVGDQPLAALDAAIAEAEAGAGKPKS